MDWMLLKSLNRHKAFGINVLFVTALGINISFCAYADETKVTLEPVTVEASRTSQLAIADAASAGIITKKQLDTCTY